MNHSGPAREVRRVAAGVLHHRDIYQNLLVRWVADQLGVQLFNRAPTAGADLMGTELNGTYLTLFG